MKTKNNLSYATHHAKQRITERTDVSLKNINNKAKHIFKNGRKIRCFNGALYDYLFSKQVDNSNYSIRVYENNIYIFDTRLSKLLTVYPVPSEFLPVSKYLNHDNSHCIVWVRLPDGSSLYAAECDSLTDDIGKAIEFKTVQKANNYVKNNNNISKLAKQGCEVVVLNIS